MRRLPATPADVKHLPIDTTPVRRKVALKIIKPGMDTKEVIVRFEAERQALALMDHPNIAKVLDAGTTDDSQASRVASAPGSIHPAANAARLTDTTGRPYFVMELVKGVPLTEYCDKNHLPVQDRLELFINVCHAIQHAHQKGIIHRDIKPSNIMVTLHDGKPVPKVIDFGVSKALSQQLTEKTLFTAYGQMIGTPAYMSPEQAELSGLDIDTRSDIYSLGVLLYELLTGSTPFDGKRLKSAGYAEMQRIIREEEPPKPSTRLTTMDEDTAVVSENRSTDAKKLGQFIRGDLDWIVMKALDKDRNRRYETANGFASDIGRFLNDEPVEACPPSVMYKCRKFIRRNKAGFSTAAIVAMSLVVGTALAAWQAFRANDALADMKIAHSNEQEQRIAAREAEKQALDYAAESHRLAEKNRQLLYISDMNRAQQDWNDVNITSVLNLLNRHRSQPDQNDLRSFEWYHLGEQCRRGIMTPQIKLPSRTFCLAYSQDGRHLATGGHDRMVRIWDANNHRLLHEIGRHPHWVHAVAFSPDGKTLASGCRKGTVKLWEVETGKLLRTLEEHPRIVNALAFSPDGKTLASSWLNTVKLWDIPSGRQKASLEGRGIVYCLSFSPDGEVLVSGAGNKMKLWDVATHKERATSAGLSGLVMSVAYSPDGKK